MKTALLLFSLLISVPALAAECPADFSEDNFLEKVRSAVSTAEDCEASARLAEACAMGSSLDTQIAGLAEMKCTQDFNKKLSAAEFKIYNGLQAKCDAKYRNMSGSMYVSFNSFCRLQVSRLYSELYTEAE